MGDDGKYKIILVHKIVANHFIGEPKDGQVLYHVNGVLTDNWASNLAYIGRKDLGKLTGAKSNRKSVVKINKDGEIVDCYSSARECGKANFMSYQTITDRCNLVYVKRSIFAPDGFAYAWEDNERKLNIVIRMIEQEVNGDDYEILSRIKNTHKKYEDEF